MVRRIGLTVVASLVLAGCGGDETTTETQPATTETSAAPTATTQAGTTTTAPAEPTRFRVFYLDGEHLAAFAAEAEGEPTAQETVEALVENAEGRETAIPVGTRVRGVTSGGGLATVDLSPEFASGGGSLSMQARVAQVVFTLTQWPWVERVTILLDGEEVEAIGGEGVPAQDLGRGDFENVVPAILVESPLAGDETDGSLQVSGSASVFEANVSLRLETAAGDAIEESFATASEGGPGRGDFETTISFDVDEPTDAVLVAYEAAADDSGEERHAVRVPVRLCPAGGC